MPLPALIPAAGYAAVALAPVVAPHVGRLGARYAPRIWRGVRGGAKRPPKPTPRAPSPKPSVSPTTRPGLNKVRPGRRIVTPKRAAIAGAGAVGAVAVGGIMVGGGPFGLGGVAELIAKKGLAGAWNLLPASVKASLLWAIGLVGAGLFLAWTARDLIIRWILGR